LENDKSVFDADHLQKITGNYTSFEMLDWIILYIHCCLNDCKHIVLHLHLCIYNELLLRFQKLFGLKQKEKGIETSIKRLEEVLKTHKQIEFHRCL
jgi:hypothetical protein